MNYFAANSDKNGKNSQRILYFLKVVQNRDFGMLNLQEKNRFEVDFKVNLI